MVGKGEKRREIDKIVVVMPNACLDIKRVVDAKR
jgi:hypothetical protein